MSVAEGEVEGRADSPWSAVWRAPEWGLLAGILAVLGVIYLLEPSHAFFSSYNRTTLLHNVALFGMLALGAATVIIAGGIDLSVGAVVALSAVVCAKLITDWLPALPRLQGMVPLFGGQSGLPAVLIQGLAFLAPPAVTFGLGRAVGLKRAGLVAAAAVVILLGLGCWAGSGSGDADVPAHSPLLIAAAIGLSAILGLDIGLLHASMINVFRLPPFIATLATMAGLRSLALVLSGNRAITVTDDAFRRWGSDMVFTVPIFAATALIMSLMMGATVIGRHLYALGGNEAAARLSGLPINRLKGVAYGLCGLLAALGGILFAGYSGQAQGTMGVAYELYAITAAVVGGCSLAGGVGSIRGTVLGLILIQIVIKGTGLVVRGIDSTQIEGLVLGTVVVLAVAFNQRFRLRS
jgi:ribose/xylose/arabinose/galactoside ABC-type transport system permease subunit